MTSRTLYRVAQDAHALIIGTQPRTVHDNYLFDIDRDLITIERYIGFLSGLEAAGALAMDDYCDLYKELMALAYQG
jgi:hypothetical protein